MTHMIDMASMQDLTRIKDVVRLAFENEAMSDHTEHLLVERLMQSADFIPELSLACRVDGHIVAYVLLSKIQIVGEMGNITSLALAPVAVLPEFCQQGMGGALIEAAHENVRKLGFGSVVVLGHADYYPRFGYQPLADFGIAMPFDAPTKNCMVKILSDGVLHGASGVVQYSAAFMV